MNDKLSPNQALEEAYARLNELERDLKLKNVSRSSLYNELENIYLLLSNAITSTNEIQISKAQELINDAISMSQVLSDLKGLLGLRGFQFPQPFSPFVSPQFPNFTSIPMTYETTSQIFPQAFQPNEPRLYQILLLVQQAKNIVISLL